MMMNSLLSKKSLNACLIALASISLLSACGSESDESSDAAKDTQQSSGTTQGTNGGNGARNAATIPTLSSPNTQNISQFSGISGYAQVANGLLVAFSSVGQPVGNRWVVNNNTGIVLTLELTEANGKSTYSLSRNGTDGTTVYNNWKQFELVQNSGGLSGSWTIFYENSTQAEQIVSYSSTETLVKTFNEQGQQTEEIKFIESNESLTLITKSIDGSTTTIDQIIVFDKATEVVTEHNGCTSEAVSSCNTNQA